MSEKKIKEPPYRDAQRCFDIRCRSKRGQTTTREENEFCERMFKLYPDWYGAQDKEVFNATKPFGARGWPS